MTIDVAETETSSHAALPSAADLDSAVEAMTAAWMNVQSARWELLAADEAETVIVEAGAGRGYQAAGVARDEAVEANRRRILGEVDSQVAGLNRLWDSQPVAASALWTDSCWDEGFVADGSDFSLVRLGTSLVASEVMPVGCRALDNVVFAPEGSAGMDDAASLVRSLVLRTAGSVAPGNLLLHLFDPVGLGTGVGQLALLGEHDSDLVGGQVWHEKSHIAGQLAGLVAHVAHVQSSFLRGEWGSVGEYNDAFPSEALPYHAVVMFDMSKRLSEAAYESLETLLRSGPAAGVFVVGTVDPSYESSSRRNTSSLLDLAWLVKRTSQGWHTQTVPGQTIRVDVDRPAPAELVGGVLGRIATAASEAVAAPVGLDRLLPEELWQESSIGGLSIPVGSAGSRSQVIEFGDSPVHALMIGETGSGKSTLIHSLIHSAAAKYSPQELELYLVDLKQGVEFKQYVSTDKNPGLPHIKVIATDAEREFALSVLVALKAKLSARAGLFKAAAEDTGMTVADLVTYRQTTGEDMPRTLAVFDEFHLLFTGTDKIANEAWDLLEYLAKEGRAFGVHVLLASQTLSGMDTNVGLRRGTLAQFGARIAMKCSRGDAEQIFGGHDNTAASALENQGDAIYNNHGGAPEGNSGFRVAFIAPADRQVLRHQICGMDVPADIGPPVVFQGDELGSLDENQGFLEAAQSDGPSNADGSTTAWLGSALRIGAAVEVSFWDDRQSHLAVLGKDAEVAAGVLCSTARSIRAQDPAARIVVFNGFTPRSPHYWLPEALVNEVSGELVVVKDLAEVFAGFSDLITAGVSSDNQATYFVGFGMARSGVDASVIRKDDFTKAFLNVLDVGTDVGIHLITAWDSIGLFKERISAAAARRVGERVMFNMAASDVASFTGVTALELKSNRAYLHSAEDPTNLTRFIPYGHNLKGLS